MILESFQLIWHAVWFTFSKRQYLETGHTDCQEWGGVTLRSMGGFLSNEILYAFFRTLGRIHSEGRILPYLNYIFIFKRYRTHSSQHHFKIYRLKKGSSQVTFALCNRSPLSSYCTCTGWEGWESTRTTRTRITQMLLSSGSSKPAPFNDVIWFPLKKPEGPWVAQKM